MVPALTMCAHGARVLPPRRGCDTTGKAFTSLRYLVQQLFKHPRGRVRARAYPSKVPGASSFPPSSEEEEKDDQELQAEAEGGIGSGSVAFRCHLLVGIALEPKLESAKEEEEKEGGELSFDSVLHSWGSTLHAWQGWRTGHVQHL